MKRDRQSQCGRCGADEQFPLHNIRHRGGTYHRLYTDCILKTRQGLLCPFCLQLFEDTRPPPLDQHLMCFNCLSISHLSCALSSAQPSFLCPTCSDPSFSFFNYSSPDSGRLNHRESAKALIAAARIATAAMTKVAIIARVEAERRATEAILAKKRAKEALEQLARLAPKDKDMEKSNYTRLQKNNKKLNSRGAKANGFKNGQNGVSARSH